MPRLSNDNAALTPCTELGERRLTFDLPGLAIGCAEYAAGPTGCTVFHFPGGADCALDVRGGSPGTVGGEYGFVHAICLAGGSLYGLEAAMGVQAELFARHGYSTDWGTIALVAGAIIFDWRPRDNAIYPDKALGRAAGAGRSATVGKAIARGWSEPAGQGGAFRQAGATRIAVFSVVNAVGAIVDRQGRVVRGHRDPADGARWRLDDYVAARLDAAGAPGDAPQSAGSARQSPSGNTTLTVVVTNQKLAPRALQQVGRQVHSSMARAIQPFHCPTDGDVLFTASTGEVDSPDLEPVALATLASELAWDAVLASFDPG